MLLTSDRFIAFASLLLLSACATGPRFQSPATLSSQEATVYVYRPDSRFQSGFAPDVYVNGRRAFAMENMGYGVLVIPPGELEIEVRYENSAMATDAERRYGKQAKTSCIKPVTHKVAVNAGQEYYMRYAMPEPLRPEPSSGALLLLGPLGIAASVVRTNNWLEEMCDFPPRLGLVNKDWGIKEISHTTLIDGATFSAAAPNAVPPAAKP
jgi:hypothetical protein